MGDLKLINIKKKTIKWSRYQVTKEHWPYYNIFGPPVDPIALNIPDYFDIIKKPMCLDKVELKLENNDYAHAFEFYEDVSLVWKNAIQYNTEGDIPNWANELRRIVCKEFSKIKKVSKKSDIPLCDQTARHNLMKVLKALTRDQFTKCFQLVGRKTPNALEYSIRKTKKDKSCTLYIHRITKKLAREIIRKFTLSNKKL